MQSRTKIIKSSLVLFLVFPFFFASCLKKVDGVDELNTNIFDREYAGDVWYVIKDIEQITNGIGEIKARLTIWIPSSNLPGLVPSNIKVHTEGDGLPVNVLDFPVTVGGDFETNVDLPYTGVGEYCIKIGIYIEEEDAAINIFESCASL